MSSGVQHQIEMLRYDQRQNDQPGTLWRCQSCKVNECRTNECNACLEKRIAKLLEGERP